MLTLIGLGLSDEKDLTLKGLELARKADKVFIELYTSYWHGDKKNLEKLVGKKIEILQRKDLEEGSGRILEDSKNKNIIIFVQGDPLIQTTHSTLVSEAKKQGIGTKIIHNSSIISAVAETGLHAQKFGPYVTIPFLERTRGRLPESVYEVIKMNKTRGLHTLCLLDVAWEENKFMLPKEAMKILLQLESQRKEDVLNEDTEIVVFVKAGSENPLIVHGRLKDLIKKEIKELPAVLIVPGVLHFTEKEYLSLFS